jgi:Fe-S-cluster containining protein
MDSTDENTKHTRECRQCGTCCKKGGPAFHKEDRHLIESGVIHTRFLYTIRQGEMARDNVSGALVPVESDIIKIKGRGGTDWTCVFFDDDNHQCTIYANRPLECRALKCWDVRDIQSIYNFDRITRKDLIGDVEGLWDLVADHQQRCAYEIIGKLVSPAQKGNPDAIGSIVEIVQYDQKLRPLLVAQSGIDAQMLDFLFGRPLTETIHMFGFTVVEKEERLILTPKL